MNQRIRDLVMRGDLDKFVLACREDDTWPSQSDAQGKTFLHHAIELKQHAIAIWLVVNGAHVNATDSDFYTPLMLAALKGSYAVASVLVAHGAKLELVEASRQTALHKAIFSRSEAIIELLIEAGANTNAEDKDLNRPLDLLFEVPSIARLLRVNRARLHTINEITPAA